MASIVNRNGIKQVQFVHQGKRCTIGVGKLDKTDVVPIKKQIENIIAAYKSGGALSLKKPTLDWLESIRGSAIEKQLVKHGLVQAREVPEAMTLGEWLTTFISQKVDSKPATLVTYSNIERNLLTCFPADKPIASFTAGDGDTFKAHLVGVERLSENTVRRRIGLARQVFRAAMRRRLIDHNPFEHLPASVRGNPKKFHFVSLADFAKLIENCPCPQWKVIIALARIGGVRCPSEVLALKWSDVDWDKNRVRITSSKTEHHEGGAERIIPLFPELADALAAAYDPDDKSEKVITRYANATKNMRTTFSKIVRRAGLKMWPKAFVNLRASRATELAAQYPAHVCSSWLGHSTAIATEHYLRVRDEDYEKAVQRAADLLTTFRASGATRPTEPAVSRRGENGDPRLCATVGGQSQDDASGAIVEGEKWALRDSNPRHPRCKRGALAN